MQCHVLSGSGHMAGFQRKDTDMQLLTLIVLIMSAVLLSALISPYIPKVSLPLVQIALGIIWYFLPFTPNLNLDDELYMILFIAPLLFFEAKGFPLSSLRRTISISLSLAIGLVLFSVVATGFSLHALWGAISLPAAMALGAALGPTDAVAVSELRKEANLSDSQVSVLHSESLLNDAASIVSFQFAIAAATTGQFSALQFTWNIAYSFLGGAVLGAVLGFLMNSLMLTLRRLSLETTTTRITIELLFPLFAYVLAENIHVSGVITVVAAGLLLRYNRMGVGSDIARTNLVSDSVWKFVTFALNGSVFVLLGIELPLAMRDSLGSPLVSTPMLLLAIVAITVILLLARFLWFIGLQMLSRNAQTGTRMGISALTPKSARSALIMTFGGAKGTISLILAFSLPVTLGTVNTFHIRDILLFIAGGYIILSLILANIILPILAPKDTIEEEKGMAQANAAMLDRTITKISELETPENHLALAMVLQSYSMRAARLKDPQSSEQQRHMVFELNLTILEWRQQWLEKYLTLHPDCETSVNHLLASIEFGLSLSDGTVFKRLRMRAESIRIRIRLSVKKAYLLIRERLGLPHTPPSGRSVAEIQSDLTNATIEYLSALMNGTDTAGSDSSGTASYPPSVVAVILSRYQLFKVNSEGRQYTADKREQWRRDISHLRMQAYQIELDTIHEMQENDEITLGQARRMRSNVYVMQSDDAFED